MLNKFLNPQVQKNGFTDQDVGVVLKFLETYEEYPMVSLSYSYKNSELDICISQYPHNPALYRAQDPNLYPPVSYAASASNDLGSLEEEESSVHEENVSSQVSAKIMRAHVTGTVFLKPSPGDPDFVSVGQQVESGTVLCLLETMKLFSEVKSQYAGVIVRDFVQHGDIVQEGDPLFEIG